MIGSIVFTMAMYFLPAYPGQIYVDSLEQPDICSGIDMHVLTV